MLKYSQGQIKILAEFLSNLSLALITASVITPAFFTYQNIAGIMPKIIIGIIASIILIYLSLAIAKETN